MKEQLDKLCSRIRISRNGKIESNGSGTILHLNTKFYFFTAYHCVFGIKNEFFDIGIENITIEVQEAFNTPMISQKVIAIVEYSQVDDWALIEIEMNVNGYPQVVNVSDFKIDSTVNFRGFQTVNNNSGRTFDCIVKELSSKNEFKISLGANEEFKQGADDARGLSGSGVFIISEQRLYLIGLLKSVKGEQALNNDIICCSVSVLQEMFPESFGVVNSTILGIVKDEKGKGLCEVNVSIDGLLQAPVVTNGSGDFVINIKKPYYSSGTPIIFQLDKKGYEPQSSHLLRQYMPDPTVANSQIILVMVKIGATNSINDSKNKTDESKKVDQLIELLQKSYDRNDLLQKSEKLLLAVHFSDYDEILNEINECKEELDELLPMQTKLISKKRATLNELQEKLIDFTNRVITTYDLITQSPINTERSKHAKEFFDAGNLDSAIGVLSNESLDNDLTRLKQKRAHAQKEQENMMQVAKIIAEDFLSRARYQIAKPLTPTLIHQTNESFTKSLDALEYFDNLFEYGFYLQRIGESANSIVYYEKVLMLDLKEFGGKNKRHSQLLNNLGLSWKDNGNFDKAIEYLNESLAIDLKILGSEDVNLAVTYNSLGSVWRSKGNLNYAINYLEKAIAINSKLFEGINLNLARDYNNLSLALTAKGSLDDAIKYLEKAMSIELVLYGEENANIAVGYNNLGKIWQTKGKGDKAISYFEKALAIYIKSFGEVNSYVAICYSNIGNAWNEKDFDKAIKYEEKALDIDLKIFGEENLSVARNYNNLGLAWKQKGNLDKAVSYLEKSIKILIKVFGEESPELCTSYDNLASVWKDKKNWDNAISYYDKAIKMGIKLFGEVNPRVASSYNNLGKVYQYKKDFKKAIYYLDKSYKIFVKTYGPLNPYTKTTKENLDFILKMNF